MMRHFLSVVFSVLACSLSFMAFGDSCVIENPITHNLDTWYFGIETGEATVWEVEPFSGDLVIPATVTKDGMEYPVRYIYQGAFEYGADFTSVTIPDSVRGIGDYAFYECAQITNIVVPASVKNVGEFAFAKCTALTNLTLAVGLEDIGKAAFSGCSLLMDIRIPQSVTHIGAQAFDQTGWLTSELPNSIAALPILESEDRCAIVWTGPEQPRSTVSLNGYRLVADEAFKGLSEIRGLMIGSRLQYVGNQAFSGCSSLSEIKSDEDASIPSHVKQVGDGAFANCAALEELTVASPATAFGEGVFEGASIKTVTGWRSDLGVNGENLETVVFADGVTEIPAGAFEGGSLESVTIPEGVTAIGARAFANSEKLKTVVLPESLKTIGEEAFAGCTSLEQINVPSNVESIGRDAFEGSPAGEGTLIGWTPERGAIGEGVTTVVIADGVTEIPDNAFAGSNIKSVSIPSSVKRIGYRAFAGCHGLTTVVIPEGVEEIAMAAFSWCDGLREVALPHSLKKTGEYAFEHCPNLKFVQITDQQGQLDVSSSRTYDGCLVDESGVVALVSVKVGKGTKSRGVLKSAVSVSVTGLDGKKKTSKSVKVEVTSAGSLVVPDLVVRDWGTVTGLKIGADGLVGHLADCDIVSADVGGALAAQNPMVVVDFSEGFGGIAGAIQTDLLPSEDEPEAFEITKAGKWAFKKAAGVKWTKPRGESEKRLVVDMDRGKTNLSAMKLTYTPKTGLFKGSFKLYSLTGTGEKTKLKKTTVTVSGFVIGGKAQGIAFVKGLPQNWGVEVR